MERVRLSARLALALSLSIALAAPTLPAQARPDGSTPSKQDLDEAQKRYKRGLDLFNEGQYDASMIELRKAHELAPSYKILYNIAQVNRQLNDYARAVEFFERYLREGGSNISASRVTEVQKELEKLRARVAKLDVTSNVAGAEVSIDDLSVGRVPFAQPLLVNAGRRKLTAVADGRPAITRIIEVAGAETVRVPLDFADALDPNRPATPSVAPPPAPSSTGSANPAVPPPDQSASAQDSYLPWVAWGVTGALAVGAGVTGVLALQAKSKYNDGRDTFPTTRSELNELNDKARTLGIVTDVLIGATAVAGGISLYLTLSRSDSKPATGRSVPASSWGVGLGPGYLGASGTF